jgi:hypothetical protein
MTEWKYNSHRLRYKEAITAICNLAMPEQKRLNPKEVSRYLYKKLKCDKSKESYFEAIAVDEMAEDICKLAIGELKLVASGEIGFCTNGYTVDGKLLSDLMDKDLSRNVYKKIDIYIKESEE